MPPTPNPSPETTPGKPEPTLRSLGLTTRHLAAIQAFNRERGIRPPDLMAAIRRADEEKARATSEESGSPEPAS